MHLFTLRLRKLRFALTNPRSRQALIRHHVLVAAEHVRALRQLGRLATVLDVGANRGQFALAVRAVNPGARIVCFEPLPGPAGVLRKVFADDSLVEVHEVAVGPHAGETVIHVSAADDSSSLLPIGELQRRLFPGTECVGTSTVRMIRLEDVVDPGRLRRPVLLKLDVQGYELEALRGCEGIFDVVDHVLVESSFVELYAGQSLADEVIDWVHDCGLRLSGIHNLSTDEQGRGIQADFLFSRRSRW